MTGRDHGAKNKIVERYAMNEQDPTMPEAPSPRGIAFETV
jgi:hypothetical protein